MLSLSATVYLERLTLASGGSFQHFHTEWEEGGLIEPSLKVAKCKCQQPALVSSSY